jgi:hypothetical protein
VGRKAETLKGWKAERGGSQGLGGRKEHREGERMGGDYEED